MKPGLLPTSPDLALSMMPSQSIPLAELVNSFQYFHSINYRDRIYALLSLASDEAGIVPDYTKTDLDVYKEFIVHVTTRQNQLDQILTPWAPVERGKKKLGSLSREGNEHVSSWPAPLESLPYGWPLPEATACPARRNGETLVSNHPRYNASNNMKPGVHFGPFITKRSWLRNCRSRDMPHQKTEVGCLQNMVLHVDGLRLGTITDLSTRMADGLVFRDALEMAGLPFTEGCEALRNVPEAIVRSLWRTLVADRDGGGGTAAAGRPPPGLTWRSNTCSGAYSYCAAWTQSSSWRTRRTLTCGSSSRGHAISRGTGGLFCPGSMITKRRFWASHRGWLVWATPFPCCLG